MRAAVHDRDNLEYGDQLLAALVRLAAHTGHNDLLAARVVLQLLLPGAIRLSNSLSWMADRPTSQALVLGELTAQIRTYPWQRRPRRIAANLLLDTRQKLTRAYHRTYREVPAGLDPQLHLHSGSGVGDDEAYQARIAVLELLRWARRSRILCTEEVRVLFGLYVCNLPPGEVAAAIGRSRSTLYAIRQRAEAKLRQAVGQGVLAKPW